MSEAVQRRVAVALAISAFAIAAAALIVAIERRAPKPAAPAPAPAAAPPPRATGDLSDSIRRIDDTHFEIARSALDTMLADPAGLGARVVPAPGGTGFKLRAVRSGSPLGRLGFRDSDTIRGVNGMNVATPADALQVYQQLRSANRLTIDLDRDGEALQISITVR